MIPRFRIVRFAAPLALGLALTSAPAAQTAKLPLTHDDYDAWRSIYTPTLTRDGRFLVYSFMPQEGDGDLVVRDLKTGQERREGVGAMPPPVIQNADEVNPDEVPAPRSLRIVTSSDSRFVAAAFSGWIRRPRSCATLIFSLKSPPSSNVPPTKSSPVLPLRPST